MSKSGQVLQNIFFPSLLLKFSIAIGIVGVIAIGGVAMGSNSNEIFSVLQPKVTEASCSNYVSGYFRSNGTYVRGHMRSCADGNPYNNYSYPGNYNPNIGRYSTGRVSTYLNNYYGYRSSSYSGYGSNYGSYSRYGSGSYSGYGSGYGYSSYWSR